MKLYKTDYCVSIKLLFFSLLIIIITIVITLVSWFQLSSFNRNKIDFLFLVFNRFEYLAHLTSSACVCVISTGVPPLPLQ